MMAVICRGIGNETQCQSRQFDRCVVEIAKSTRIMCIREIMDVMYVRM